MAIQGTTMFNVQVNFGSDSKLSRAFVNGQLMLPAESLRPAPLTDEQWEALSKVERRLYDNDGMHAWTDVMVNDGDSLLRAIWDHCEASLDGAGDLEGASPVGRNYMIAHRVARALKLMAFGPESLIA